MMHVADGSCSTAANTFGLHLDSEDSSTLGGPACCRLSAQLVSRLSNTDHILHSAVGDGFSSMLVDQGDRGTQR